MDGTIEAKVCRVVTEPYSDQELASMREAKRRYIKLDKVEKIVAEERLADIRTLDRNELKSQVIDLCIRQAPYPIVVKLANNDTLDRTYIVDKRFRSSDPEAIWENIIFGYNQKGKEILEFLSDKLIDMNRSREAGGGRPSKSENIQTGLEQLLKRTDLSQSYMLMPPMLLNAML